LRLDSDPILEPLPPKNRIPPAGLISCQDTTEPFAMASNRISRSFAAPGAAQSRSGVEDAIDNVMGVTPHASRVNGTVSVATIPWRFTYFCWNMPYVGLDPRARAS
jgi:hypothetical protein